MEILLLILMTALLLIGFAFQIRDIYITTKYRRTRNSESECGFLRIHENERGHAIGECGNIFYDKEFVRNDETCPTECRGRICSDAKENLELMFTTDVFYSVKKVVYLCMTFFGVLLTILNIVDKI